METVQQTDLEQIQGDHESPEISVDVESRRDVKGADTLHGALNEMADDFRASGFKCVHEACGLVHGHDTTKHRSSDSFDMSDEEAADMEFNPNCHCGLNELARSGHDDAPSPSRANSTAPIPDSASRAMDKMY